MSAPPVAGTSTPILDRDGRPHRAFNPFDNGSRRPSSTGPLNRRGTRALVGLALPVLVLVLWQWVTSAGIVAPYQLPSPASVWNAAVDLAERNLLAPYVAISTQRVLIGFAIGSAIGLLLGAVVGLSRLGDALLAPTLGAIRAVPSLAWVPLLILWMKIGEDSKITLIAIGAFFPVYTTVASALRHVDPHLVEAGRAYGLRGVRLFSGVQLPAVLPSVVSGLRLALAQSWLFLVAAELIASSMGLGFLLMESGNNGRVDRIILAIILLALLGKLTDSLIGLAEKYLLKRWA
ncbi:ABC transporter permease [Cellulomonas fengjieae]|uniref:ABC transporter permease n=1 Tax=Cellulomonas fengjieae TaxID=2819978 RepID=A0ABS3SGT1_9CELL|nr:ABC transporter permease [Cellulomonas fengjieae]MBO3084544.1 ABC transporter permease [Cellulomonas fengjieae]MBO3103316.1 ABC transporter permease [Cellulomonas fengjieae]QVI67123.1 ABC transporter permease [Cellulomonas fengjieae]